jgi:hypothetical protein
LRYCRDANARPSSPMRDTSSRFSASAFSAPASASASDSASTPLAYQRAPPAERSDAARNHVHHATHGGRDKRPGRRHALDERHRRAFVARSLQQHIAARHGRQDLFLPTQPFHAPAIPIEKAPQHRAVRPIARDHKPYVLAALCSAFSMVAASSAMFFTGTMRPNQPTVSGPLPAADAKRNNRPAPGLAARRETCAPERCETSRSIPWPAAATPRTVHR